MTGFLSSYPLVEAVCVTAAFGILARALGTVTGSGFVGGVVVGSAIYYCAGWRGFVVLGVFFALGSALTRLGYRRKNELGAAQADSGRRGARHAAANCAAGVLLALGYKLTGGDPVWAAGFVASFATAAADTAGSEIGPLCGSNTVLAASFEKVPPGTSGAVSLEGTAAGIVAALVVAAAALAVGLLSHPELVLLVVVASAVAAWAESILGGIAGVERRLGNEGMNLINTTVGALLCMAMTAMR